MANLAAQRFYTWYGSAGFWAEGSYTATRVNSGTVRLSGTITMKCWATSNYTNGWYMDRVAVKV